MIFLGFHHGSSNTSTLKKSLGWMEWRSETLVKPLMPGIHPADFMRFHGMKLWISRENQCYMYVYIYICNLVSWDDEIPNFSWKVSQNSMVPVTTNRCIFRIYHRIDPDIYQGFYRWLQMVIDGHRLHVKKPGYFFWVNRWL